MIGAQHISIALVRGRPISHSHVKNCERRKGGTGELIYRSARTPCLADADLSDSIADGGRISNPRRLAPLQRCSRGFPYLSTFAPSGHDDYWPFPLTATQINAAQSGEKERRVFDADAPFAVLKTLGTGPMTNHVTQCHGENRFPAVIHI